MNLSSDVSMPGDDIDMDRVIIDPDYRRRVLAKLRRSRVAEEAPLPAPSSPSRAAGETSSA